MKILIVGSGAREHAIAWSLYKDSRVEKIFVAPGNGGISQMGPNVENVAIKATDIDGLIEFSKTNAIDLVVVGPEQPLELGIVNEFEKHNIKIFGPSKEAAQLETSKSYAKNLMKHLSIPTAAFLIFRTHREASAYFHEQDQYPQVIKASGLAGGKGVTIAESKAEALMTLIDLFENKKHGDAANEVIIEECMTGQEASIFAITDGKSYKLLSPAQDHKRIGEGDTGKNTGGMGAYAPAPTFIINDDVIEKVKKQIIEPVLTFMSEEDNPYKGFLYVGLMIENNQPRVVEFNARLGDPEAQVVLPLLKTSLLDLILASVEERLSDETIELLPKTAATVVMASGGYPDEYKTGNEIIGLDRINNEKGLMVFHAGTRSENSHLVTSGGRVLSVTAIGDTLKEALSHAYRGIEKISFAGAYYRKDIGQKGL